VNRLVRNFWAIKLAFPLMNARGNTLAKEGGKVNPYNPSAAPKDRTQHFVVWADVILNASSRII
jgi:hypothetical protein